MIPVTETLLLDQPHSVITGDDLVPIVLNVAGALKCLKLGISDERSLMSDHVLRAPPLLQNSPVSLLP